MAKSLEGLGVLLQYAALAGTSQKQYLKAWKQWCQWCVVMRMPHVLSKKNEEKNTVQMGAYAVYLWRFGMNKKLRENAYSTIVGKLSAVRWYHRRLGYVPAVNAAHGLLLSGIKRMTNPVTKKHPLTPKMLRALKGKLKLTNPRDQLMWGGCFEVFLSTAAQ